MAPVLYVLSQFSFDSTKLIECLPSLGTSLLLSALASLVALVLAFPVAFATVIPSRIGTIMSLVSGLLLAVPDIVLGVALLMLYGKSGIFGLMFGDIFVNTWLGLLVAQLYCLTPYCIVLVMQVFRNTNKDILEAAYALGATRWTVAIHIYLRSNLRGLTRVYVTCVSFGLSMFGVIVVFAYWPKVMTTEIFERFHLFEFDDAMTFATYLLVLAFLLYGIATAIERRRA
jgi:ABC-type sulfate transport system permease component